MTATILGAEVGPLGHEIDARWLMAYAAALGEADARCYDTLTAGGPIAHPLFAVCYEWPVLVAMRDRTIPAELQPRSVHATHHGLIHRPVRAGDRLLTTARIVDLRARRSGTLVVTRLETVDGRGERVTTTDYGSIYRGLALPGAEGSPRAAPEPAGGLRRPPAASTWSDAVEVPARLAWVYTECARIWNPIHTDLGVARGAGLPAPILHGTATLALGISRALRHHGIEAASVREIAARFTGMVAMPCTLTVRGGDRTEGGVDFGVLDEAGAPVLVDGRLRLDTGRPDAETPARSANPCSR